MKYFAFRVVAVYAPNSVRERRSFLQCLVLFLDYPKQIVLGNDWNTIFDPMIDKFERGSRELDSCESGLIDFMARHDLDRITHRERYGRGLIVRAQSVLGLT